jgi:hypothetical protein
LFRKQGLAPLPGPPPERGKRCPDRIALRIVVSDRFRRP